MVAQFGYANFRMMSISQDHSKILFVVDVEGEERYSLFLREMKTGRLSKLEDFENVVTAEWVGDSSSSFLYTQADSLLRPFQVKRHSLNQPTAEEDKILFEEGDERFYLDITRTKDHRFMTINVNSKVTSEVWILDPREEEPKLLKKREEGTECFVESGANGAFFLLTNANNSKNYKVSTLPHHQISTENWTDLVTSSEEGIIEDIEVFRDFLVLHETRKGAAQIRVMNLQDGSHQRVPLPFAVCSIEPFPNKDFEAQTITFSLSTPHTPPTFYSFDMKEGILTRLEDGASDELLSYFNPNDYILSRHFVPSSGGVEVPVTIIQGKEGKGKTEKGKNPALVLGYGAYGVSVDLNYRPFFLPLLNRGWALVFSHVRGGREMGRDWHLQGKLLAKKNSFEDLKNTCHYLFEKGYAHPKKLCGLGTSAGGLLFAATSNQNAELFAGLILRVPFLDVYHSMMDENLALTKHEFDEWGNPKDPSFAKYIQSYCPYSNITATPKPAMLIKGSMKDLRVPYWHPLKFVTKIRSMVQDSNNVILNITSDEGHFGHGDRLERINQAAIESAFLSSVIQRV